MPRVVERILGVAEHLLRVVEHMPWVTEQFLGVVEHLPRVVEHLLRATEHLPRVAEHLRRVNTLGQSSRWRCEHTVLRLEEQSHCAGRVLRPESGLNAPI